MIVRVPMLAGIGGAPTFTELTANAPVASGTSFTSSAVDFTVYAWAGLSIAAVVWAFSFGPAAKHRREEIKKAKQRVARARRLPRIGVA